jgi:cbb3-type cytochrome oxidase cytochrome c subunit
MKKFDIHSSHRAIVLIPTAIYLVLVWIVAVAPARKMAADYPVGASGRPVPELVQRGEAVFKSMGCAVCHTQQIRGDERVRVQKGDRWVVPVRAPDARYGLDEPTSPEEYADADPPLIGTQRTGPDLTGVGDRLPSALWHYWHLYDPRSVSPGSTMPSYRFLFRVVPEGQGPEAVDEPFNTGKGYLIVGVVVVVFAFFGWLLFGVTPALAMTVLLGVAAGLALVKDCEVCAPPSAEGEIVEEGIDALGLPPGTQLYADGRARALAEYLLWLRRPVRGP